MSNGPYRFIFVVLAIITGACSSVYTYIDDERVLGWEPDIRIFDSLNALEPADEHLILVAGSSSVRLWDSIHADLEPFRVIRRGYGGAKLTDFNHYADRIIGPGRFKAIVIFIANDITGGEDDRTPREVLKLFEILVEGIRERNPGTPVFWIETTPTPSRWQAIAAIRRSNALIREYCGQYDDLHFISTYDSFLDEQGLPDPVNFRDDMLHLNRAGYARWSGIIKAELMNEHLSSQ